MQAGAYGFGVVATDYDDDGFVDLFVANDSNPNFLYRNLGTGRFESVGLLAGVAVNDQARAQAGMGADAADYDGDLRTDITLTAFAHDRNTLYRNVDGRQFEDATTVGGPGGHHVPAHGLGHGVCRRRPRRPTGSVRRQRPHLRGHRRLPAAGRDLPSEESDPSQPRQRRFSDVSARAGGGLQVERVGRGLAIGDLDDDGDPDVVVSNVDDAPTLLENRQRTGHHWLAVRVTAPAGNRFGIGAKVTVTAGGRTQVREIRSGGSYLSQSDLRAYFGLGESAGPVAVEIRMPGGARGRWDGLAADRLHVLDVSKTSGAGPSR